MVHWTSPAAGEISYVPFDSWDGLEDVQLYNVGGFHPVHLGDLLGARFEVIHKLGHGGFGIVWLCLDIVSREWRAVKILAADRSVAGGDEDTMRYLTSQASLKELEDNHIAPTLETFWIDGPNGWHFCSVMEVLGSTVADWSMGLDPLVPSAAANIKDACRQIAKGVQYLHKHGICHGDLRAHNVLMRLKGIDQLEKTQLLELTGEPECYDVQVLRVTLHRISRDY
ncbi:hypothetical protein SLS62_001014 [Diatrype stigma]|uniref:EKC/KEOPS complex subunit BUD32 n=1 Tax=Diatrype stigma TaxID=117547 RepID=A0AAN9VBD9_9PEZI